MTKPRRKRVRRNNTTRRYDDKKYTAWRKAVRKRDGGKCQWPTCERRRPLHVHHIRKWAKHPLLRYNVNNGICLCSTHHKLTYRKEERYELMFYRIVLRNT